MVTLLMMIISILITNSSKNGEFIKVSDTKNAYVAINTNKPLNYGQVHGFMKNQNYHYLEATKSHA